ncbi:hypothetical protein BA062_22100 [Prauserella flavalba]|uniref:Uncharacterized protein n=2 Tax=Prauserella flavalba TaxID=1477506 RepID=A0A318LV31_9PSEU|nr:hypothetical protein BA062_22100 [Prauserella flavalba]
MLSVVVEELALDGWRVVSPSRRYVPLPATDDAAVPPPRWSRGRRKDRVGAGKAIWVEAHWDRPRELATKVEKALTAPAELLVAWVHESYRRSVLGVVEPLLTATAPVVEVRSLVDLAAVPDEPEPVLFGHPTQQVLLGSVSELAATRPLGHDEIWRGVLYAVERALEGRPSSLHQLGERRPVHGH